MDLKTKTQTLNKNSVPIFFSTMFDVLNGVKKLHLIAKNKSYAEHMALGAFYENFQDLLDTFIETYYGKFGVINFTINGSEPRNSIDFVRTKTVYFESCYELFKDGFLVNQLDTILQECYHVLYKLENLK